jgi:hypothetical protein
VHPGYVNSGIWNLNKQNSMLERIKEGAVKVRAYFFAITPQQGSLAILHGAVSETAGPDVEKQGVGQKEGKGGGRYFNRIWEEEVSYLSRKILGKGLLMMRNSRCRIRRIRIIG